MNAQLVNAVNLPVQNGLNFPAAILQRPFYDPKADVAVNYCTLGAVIGHEITHGFDSMGRLFDANGALRTQRAHVVILACNGVGTARLLLNSKSAALLILRPEDRRVSAESTPVLAA